MDGKIAKMPEELSRKIAAGEVIERPASIVKELVENSLDAGASEILIELERGGNKSIKVTDNGCGIGQEEISLAFERHATSKIHTFDDMFRIASFGFRGEALPSIASVSKVEMVTRKKGTLAGTRICLESGEIKDMLAAGCPVGTSIFVDDLFFSVPVRKKFLKKDVTERNYCIEMVTRLSLPHPDVRISLTADGKKAFSKPLTNGIKENLGCLFGEEYSKNIVSAEIKKGRIKVRGFFSRPNFHRSNTKGIYVYVNRRYIRDNVLNHAVMNAYRRLIDEKRYPYVVLFIEVPADEMDVNVHPSKLEVRFRNSQEIYAAVVEAAAEALANIGIFSESRFRPREREFRNHTQSYETGIRDALKRYAEKQPEEVSAELPHFNFLPHRPPMNELEFTMERDIVSPIPGNEDMSFAGLDYLGHIGGTYLIFSGAAGMVLIDQHAAHERILFEKLKRRSAVNNEEHIQVLLMPEIISLQPSFFNALMEHLEPLKTAGFDMEPYGENTIIVKTVPALLAVGDIKALIHDIVDELSDAGRMERIRDVKEEILTVLACRGAVKAHQPLTAAEIGQLCHDLDAYPNAASCPHGRPVYVLFQVRDMEKMFRRR